MRRTTLACSAFALVMACGKSEDRPASAPEAPAPAPASPAATPSPAAAPTPSTTPTPTPSPTPTALSPTGTIEASVETLLPPTPGLPPLFAARGLSFGMTRAACDAKAPLMCSSSAIVEPGWVAFRVLGDVDAAPSDPIRVFMLAFEDPRAQARIESRWGPAVTEVHDGESAAYWVDQKAGIRAKLTTNADHQSFLELLRFRPLDALLGPDKGPPAFETKPILGQSLAEVQAAYGLSAPELSPGAGPDDLTTAHFELEPTEFTEATPTILTLSAQKDMVLVYSLGLSCDDRPSGCDVVAARLEAKWGAPSKDEDGDLTWTVGGRTYGLARRGTVLLVTVTTALE